MANGKVGCFFNRNSEKILRSFAFFPQGLIFYCLQMHMTAKIFWNSLRILIDEESSFQQSNWLCQMTKDFHIVFDSFAMLKSGSEKCAMSDFFFLFPENIIQLPWKVFWKDEASCWQKKKTTESSCFCQLSQSTMSWSYFSRIFWEFQSKFWRTRIAKSLSNQSRQH